MDISDLFGSMNAELMNEPSTGLEIIFYFPNVPNVCRCAVNLKMP